MIVKRPEVEPAESPQSLEQAGEAGALTAKERQKLADVPYPEEYLQQKKEDALRLEAASQELDEFIRERCDWLT